MKKYLYLTSLFALSACFGGGSGTIGNVTPSGASVSMFNGLITQGAVDSNHNITQMTSGVIVATDGSSHAVRSGAPISSGGHTYNVYDLSDVEFKIAENPAQGNFKFAIENGTGRIAKVTETLGGVADTIARIGDTQRFNGPIFEYVSDTNDGDVLRRVVDDGTITMTPEEDYDPNATNNSNKDLTHIAHVNGLTGGHWNRVDEILDIGTGTASSDTNVTDPDIQLMFSDFGKFHPVYRSKHKNITPAMLAAIRAADSEINTFLANNDKAGLMAWLQENYSTTLTGNSHSYNTATEQENEFATSQDYQLFAGGYAINGSGELVDTLTPTNGMHFSGKGIGRVYTSIQTPDGYDRAGLLDQYHVPYYVMDGDNKVYYNADTDELKAIAKLKEKAGHDMAQYFETVDTTEHPGAELDFVDGTATLTMRFPDFYTVTAVKTGNSDAVVSFSDKSDDLPAYLTRDASGTTSTSHDYFGYYGVVNPTEAAGTVQVADQKVYEADETVPTVWREWEFQGAYGMNKDN